MNSDLKEYLDANFARIDERFVELEERFNKGLDDRIERAETALLTEFHKWASAADMRAKSHALAIRAMDLELDRSPNEFKSWGTGTPGFEPATRPNLSLCELGANQSCPGPS